MPNYPPIFASEQEIQELRDELRTLREAQEQQKKQLSESKSQEPPAQANGKQEKDDRQQHDNKPPEGEQEQKKPHPLRKYLIIAGAIAVAAIAIAWWLYSRQFETTDDANVDGHISGIAGRIAGTVTAVYADENQFVQSGEVLVDLDPRDYNVAVDQARSQLRQAQAQARAEQPNIPVTEVTNETNISTTGSSVVAAEAGVAEAQRNYEAALAKVTEAQANHVKAQADVERFRPLAQKDEVPQQQFDQVIASARSLDATVASTQASAEAVRKQVDQNREQLAQAQQRAEEARKTAPSQVAIRQANVAVRDAARQAAQSQLDQAMLNLSYCKILAPVGGIVAKRIAEVGQHVTPGQQVMLITQIGDLWVTANYKETQLRRMRDGQGVRIHVDALSTDFDGYLESLPAASGAVTSLLPPENATGNFVKVVQRLPVRIRFKPNQSGLDRLRPGMSVEPKIRVQ